MIRNTALLLLATVAGCRRESPAPAIVLERRAGDSAVTLLDPSDPIGVTAGGLVVARLAGQTDTAFRLVDSSGRVVGVVAVTGVGTWLAGDDGLLYTMASEATSILSVKPDGSAGPSYQLGQPAILRGVWGDSVDLVRPGVPGFSVLRVALAGAGERVMVPEGAAEAGTLLDISPLGGGVRSQLASITTTKDRVIIANGGTYRMLVYSAAGELLGTMGRAADSASPPRLTKRQIDAEIRQIRTSDTTLTEKYLSSVRKQLERQRMPFFSAAQGIRFDPAGRLWVVGYSGDSAFADVFADTTFVQRVPLRCPGFDGQWDLKGSWLAVGCGRRDPAAQGGELQLYRITEGAPGAR